jgi:Na+-transporting methylmalonyl-CoA/oxaloacetate decarboxylase gamma subunit
MLQRPDDQWKPAGRRDSSGEITTLLAVNGIVVLVLLILALTVPSASEWISAAAQAEFVNPDVSTAAPTQIAQPLQQMRIVGSN